MSGVTKPILISRPVVAPGVAVVEEPAEIVVDGVPEPTGGPISGGHVRAGGQEVDATRASPSWNHQSQTSNDCPLVGARGPYPFGWAIQSYQKY